MFSMTNRLAIIAEPQRQRILQIVWRTEKPAGEIAKEFDVTFGAVSQHLRILRTAGLVMMTKRGKQHFYRADREALGTIAQYLEAMWRTGLTQLNQLTEAEEHSR
jgi:DNA-binding transcriptional ArsR family regulator